jgi:hypothetical protein
MGVNGKIFTLILGNKMGFLRLGAEKSGWLL